MLECKGLSKSYSTKVLDSVDLRVDAGEIHALLGSNGAGKSTLCNLIAGSVSPDSGEIEVSGNTRYVTQHPNLVDDLSVAENLLLGDLPNQSGFINRRSLYEEASELLAKVGLDHVDANSDITHLGVGERQLLSIARALRGTCALLILDEPTAALTTREVTLLFERIRDLARDGVAVLYVTHRMSEVRELCQRFTVLRDGLVVGSNQVDQVGDSEIIKLLAGESISPEPQTPVAKGAATCLEVRGMSGTDFENITFSLSEGERLGIAGLVGSGRTEILRSIFGAECAETGQLVVRGCVTDCYTHPRQAVDAGIAMITEDRHVDGVVLPESIAFNVNLAQCPQARGIVNEQQAADRADQVLEDMSVRAQSIEQPVTELSGGNQQKVAIGKWVSTPASIYLFDEPTRGIDVGARKRVHRLFVELSAKGCGQLIVSSDIDELMSVCHRILVIASGELVSEFHSEDWNRSAIVGAMFGRERGSGV